MAKLEPINESAQNEVLKNNEGISQTNNDIKEIDQDSIETENEKRFERQEMFDIRNSSIISNSQNYNNQSMLTVSRDKKGRKGLSSVNRAANDNVTMLKSIYESRPMTIFFQYPEYWWTARSTDNTVVFTQNEFKYEIKSSN